MRGIRKFVYICVTTNPTNRLTVKKFFVSFWLLSAVLSAGAQNTPLVKSAESTNEDVFKVLKMLGASSYRFDLSEFSSEKYEFKVYMREYVNGERIKDTLGIREQGRFFPNWRQLPPVIDKEWNDFLIEKNPKLSADGQKYLCCEALGVQIVKKTDTTAIVGFDLYGASGGSFPLNLKKLDVKWVKEPMYESRPIKVYPMSAEKKRIPLLLYASYWVDAYQPAEEQFLRLRFCTERELEPNLSNESLKNCPHYYVIGIEVRKVK